MTADAGNSPTSLEGLDTLLALERSLGEQWNGIRQG